MCVSVSVCVCVCMHVSVCIQMCSHTVHTRRFSKCMVLVKKNLYDTAS